MIVLTDEKKRLLEIYGFYYRKLLLTSLESFPKKKLGGSLIPETFKPVFTHLPSHNYDVGWIQSKGARPNMARFFYFSLMFIRKMK